MTQWESQTKKLKDKKKYHFNEVNFLSQSHKETGSKSVTYTASVAIKGTGLD